MVLRDLYAPLPPSENGERKGLRETSREFNTHVRTPLSPQFSKIEGNRRARSMPCKLSSIRPWSRLTHTHGKKKRKSNTLFVKRSLYDDVARYASTVSRNSNLHYFGRLRFKSFFPFLYFRGTRNSGRTNFAALLRSEHTLAEAAWLHTHTYAVN